MPGVFPHRTRLAVVLHGTPRPGRCLKWAPMPNLPVALVSAYLAERDVVVTDVTRHLDGSYEVWARGERVNVGAPATPDKVVQWAHRAADQVVERLGNRMLRR